MFSSISFVVHLLCKIKHVKLCSIKSYEISRVPGFSIIKFLLKQNKNGYWYEWEIFGLQTQTQQLRINDVAGITIEDFVSSNTFKLPKLGVQGKDEHQKASTAVVDAMS